MDAKKAAILASIGIGGAVATYLILRTYQPTPPLDIYCPYCGAGPFHSYEELMAHIEAAHPGAPPVYICMYDGLPFSSLEELEEHIIAAHRTLWLKVGKFPGAGDPTNTIEVSTDRGIVGTVESGRAGEYPETNIPLSKDDTWVMLRNLNGSALELVKYPLIGGIALADFRVLEHSAFFRDEPWHPNALGERWSLDWVKFSLPALQIPPQVTVRLEAVAWVPSTLKVYYSPTRTFEASYEVGTWSISQFYPARAVIEFAIRAGGYIRLEGLSGRAFILKRYWRGLQLLAANPYSEDLHEGEVQDYWSNYELRNKWNWLVFQVVGR